MGQRTIPTRIRLKQNRSGTHSQEAVMDPDVSALVRGAARNHVFHKHTHCI